MLSTQKKTTRALKKKAIEDKVSRVNIKSKRKRTLLRKAIEVSQLCSLDILIVIRDKETRKIYEYNSGRQENQLFTLKKAVEAKVLDNYFSIVYNDSSYDQLVPNSKFKGAGTQETEEDIQSAEFKQDMRLESVLEGPLLTNNSLKVQKMETDRFDEASSKKLFEANANNIIDYKQPPSD